MNHIKRLLISFALLSVSSSANAQLVQDQFFPGSSLGASVFTERTELAQTFPVSVDGYLDSVSVWFHRAAFTSEVDVLWDVRPVVAGAPDSLVLASGVIDGASAPVFPDLPEMVLDLSGFLIRVNAGDDLAITLRGEGAVDAFDNWRSSTQPNASATSFQRINGGSWDEFSFPGGHSLSYASVIQTIPEPAMTTLGVPALVALTLRRRRNR